MLGFLKGGVWVCVCGFVIIFVLVKFVKKITQTVKSFPLHKNSLVAISMVVS